MSNRLKPSSSRQKRNRTVERFLTGLRGAGFPPTLFELRRAGEPATSLTSRKNKEIRILIRI